MGRFTAIELEKLPEPTIVETLTFSSIKDSLIAYFKNRATDYNSVVESDPAYKILESVSYLDLLIRARINDAVKGNMLAKATGSDLDHLAARNGVQRLEGESDSRFRTRIQLALEAFTTAGSEGSYTFYALTSSPKVKDVDIYGAEDEPYGRVFVTVLSTVGDGKPDDELLNIVNTSLSYYDVRPLTDFVIVQTPEIIHYTVDATLFFYSGPDPLVVKALSEQKLNNYVTEHHLLGHDIPLSGIYAALHQIGVQRVVLNTPTDDIVVQRQQAAYCDGFIVSIGGLDE